MARVWDGGSEPAELNHFQAARGKEQTPRVGFEQPEYMYFFGCETYWICTA